MFNRATFFAFIAVVSICTSAQAQIGVSAPPVARPALVTCTNMELLKQVPCPDSELFFHEGQALVQSAFNARDFAKLDALYSQWCSGKDRFPDGRWKLSQYEVALYQNFSAWNTWAKDLDTIKSWQNKVDPSVKTVFQRV